MQSLQLLFLCPRWGSDTLLPSEFVAKVIETGYDGVEVGLAEFNPAVDEVIRRAKDAGLVVVTQHYDTAVRDLSLHLKNYEARLRLAAGYQPRFINSHTGRDFFTLAENKRIFALAGKIAGETGIPVYHETHRSRCCHTPWRTVELLKDMPEVRLVLDMSHWCVVCESLLEDQDDLMNQVIPCVEHVHARVGWSQGPQVSDPRAPEWESAIEAHLKWWDKIVALKRATGAEALTICPEFGPVPYLPVLPYSQKPVANQWEINAYMMNTLRKRYKEVGSGAAYSA